jgi:hypothetical protein
MSVFHPSPHIWQGLIGPFTSVQAKKVMGWVDDCSLGVQEEAVKTPGVYPQRIVCEGLRVIHM